MRDRRGQQAVEYLTTYVYATIAVVLVIGAISYLEVFKPEEVVEEECSSGEQLACIESLIIDNGTVSVNLENRLERDVTITNFTLYYGEKEVSKSLDLILEPGDNKRISINSEEDYFEAGKEERAFFAIEYKPKESVQVYRITGLVKARTSLVTDLVDWTKLCGDGDVQNPDTGYPDADEECDPPTFRREDNDFIQINDISGNGCPGNTVCGQDCHCTDPVCGNGVVEYNTANQNSLNEICDFKDPATRTAPCDGSIYDEGILNENEINIIKKSPLESSVDDELNACHWSDNIIDSSSPAICCTEDNPHCNTNDACRTYDSSQCRALQTYVTFESIYDVGITKPAYASDQDFDVDDSQNCCLKDQCTHKGVCYNIGTVKDLNNDGYGEVCEDRLWALRYKTSDCACTADVSCEGVELSAFQREMYLDSHNSEFSSLIPVSQGSVCDFELTGHAECDNCLINYNTCTIDSSSLKFETNFKATYATDDVDSNICCPANNCVFKGECYPEDYFLNVEGDTTKERCIGSLWKNQSATSVLVTTAINLEDSGEFFTAYCPSQDYCAYNDFCYDYSKVVSTPNGLMTCQNFEGAMTWVFSTNNDFSCTEEEIRQCSDFSNDYSSSFTRDGPYLRDSSCEEYYDISGSVTCDDGNYNFSSCRVVEKVQVSSIIGESSLKSTFCCEFTQCALEDTCYDQGYIVSISISSDASTDTHQYNCSSNNWYLIDENDLVLDGTEDIPEVCIGTSCDVV